MSRVRVSGIHFARAATLFCLFAALALALSFGGGVRSGGETAKAQTATTPLILVPGVGGTYIMDGTREKWPRANSLALSTSDEFLLDLRLRADGTESPYRDYQVGDIVRKAHVTLFPDPDFYHTTVQKLEAAGYREGADLFVYPYDWRKDVRGNNGRGDRGFINFIDRVRNKTGAPRVDVMAHSMGGMVTLAALEDSRSVGKIRKVLTLGTPVLGATKSLGMLQYRMPCFVESFGICLTNRETTQKILENMPGGYQLLPSRAFDRAVRAPLYIDMDTNGDGVKEGAQTYYEWAKIVRASHNGALLDRARYYHYASDTLTLADPNVKLRRVAADGLGTVDRIRQYRDCFLGYFSCDTEYELKNGAGDGTVPLHSADLYNPKTGFDRRGPGPVSYFHGVEHGDLVKDDAVMSYALSYFGHRTSATAATPLTIQPSLADDGEADHTPQPGGFDGTELEVVGPAEGYVEDAGGQAIGVSAELSRDVTGEIPGGSYNAIGDTKSFFLNEAGRYSGRLTVTGEDSMVRLRIRTYEGAAISGQAVFFVEAPRGAKLDLRFGGPGQSNLRALKLEIDRDGDGKIDGRIAPDSLAIGPEAPDDDAPAAHARVEKLGGGMSRISLGGSDLRDDSRGRPSGVSSVYYVLGDGKGKKEKVKPYKKPIVLKSGTPVNFLAVDDAGNASPLKRVKTE